jgi:serine/threonine-protein kinase
MAEGARLAPDRRDGSTRAISDQLERVLASDTFRQAARLKRFLTFVVREAMAGRADQLKEYVIGVQVFDREPGFDPRTDPIVRVQARRLRSRLAKYYEDEGAQDRLLIDLPKGRYAPLFQQREASSDRRPPAHVVSQNTVAVVGIEDCSPERTMGYVCEGLRAELIHAITRTEGLRVVAPPPRSTHAGRDDTGDGATVHPAFEITGSLRTDGRRLRLTAHIIDSPTGTFLSSDSADGSVDDPLTVQESIATSVARRLQADVAGRGNGRQLQRPVENLSARNLYLQGRYHLDQRTEEGLKRSVEFFEKSLAEDPQYALAHSGLSDAFALLGHYGVLGPADVWPKAASSAASAVMLDSHASEAHTSLAHMKATQDWDWPASEREFRLAISLDRGYATAHHWYAMSCLIPLGRLDEALDEMFVAQSLDPVSSIVARDIATIQLYRRDLDAALEHCDHTVELNPYFSPAYWTLGLIQEQREELDEALAACQRGLHLSPESPRMHAALGRVLALTGDQKAAAQSLRTLRDFATQRYVSPVEFACLHLSLGQPDRALQSLAEAARDRCFDLLAIRYDPRFDPLKDDERFRAIVSQIGIE